MPCVIFKSQKALLSRNSGRTFIYIFSQFIDNNFENTRGNNHSPHLVMLEKVYNIDYLFSFLVLSPDGRTDGRTRLEQIISRKKNY